MNAAQTISKSARRETANQRVAKALKGRRVSMYSEIQENHIYNFP